MSGHRAGYQVSLQAEALADDDLEGAQGDPAAHGDAAPESGAWVGSHPGLVAPNLLPLVAVAFLEVRLVWDRAARHYAWHLVVEDGTQPAPPPPEDRTAAVDL